MSEWAGKTAGGKPAASGGGEVVTDQTAPEVFIAMQ